MPWLGLVASFLFLISSFSRAESAFDPALLRSADPETVASAVDRFRSDPDPRALPFLLSLLSDPDPLLRREAARGLGAIKRADARKALLKRAREDPDLDVRVRAVLSLKEQGQSDPLRELERELTERLADPKDPARSALIDALVSLRSKRSIPHLKKILRDPDEDLTLRLKAVSGLAELKDRSLFPRLLTQLRSRSEAEKLVAVTGLGILEDRRAVPFLMKGLADRSAPLRRATASALGRLGDPRPAPELRRLLESDDDQEVRWRSASALARIRDPEGLPLIRKRLWEGGTPGDREAALRAWSESEDLRVLPWLEEGVMDRALSIEMRKSALRRLTTLGGEGERGFIMGIASSMETEEALKEIARSALGAESVTTQAPPRPASPISPFGFLPPSPDRPLIFYRGPLLPLFRFDPDRETWTPFLDEGGLVRSRAPAFLPFETREEALIVKEGEKEERYPFPEGSGPILVSPDREGESLWWGARGMLGRFDPAEKRFVIRKPRALDGANVVSFSIDGEIAWIGWERNGASGLLRIDLQRGDETLFDRHDSGLLNGSIRSILPEGNRLWLAQTEGIVRFDPASREGDAYRFVLRGGEPLVIRQRLAPIEPAGPDPLEQWVEEIDLPDPARRIEAIRRLGLLKDPEAIPKLLARLREGTPVEGEMASWALAQIGSPRSIGPLIDLLMAAPPERILFYLTAVGEVGTKGGRADLGPLVLFLENPRPEVVARALSTFGQLGDGRAAPLINLCLSSQDPRIARAASEALGLLVERTGPGPQESTPAVGAVRGMLDRLTGTRLDVRSVESDLASLDYQRTIAALYRLGTPGLSLSPTIGGSLIRFLGVEDRDVRWGAISLFDKLGAEGVAILGPLLHHSREEVRRDAVRALSRSVGLAEVPGLLISRLPREPAPAVRKEIVIALAPLLRDERWREKVRSALSGLFRFDPSPESRRQALLLLSDAGAEPPLQDLVDALKVNDVALRIEIISRIVRGRPKNLPAGAGAASPLERTAEGILREDPGNRALKQWAVQLARAAGLRSMTEILIALLPDQPVSVRLGIEDLLGTLGDSRAIPALIQGGEKGDARERYACLLGLKRLGQRLTGEEEAWLAAGPP
jgi:HEAT repeat protein